LHAIDALSPPPLRAAVEMAVWDLLGHVLRQPLCNLLGGYYRRRVPIAMQLAGSHPKTIGNISRELADQGFHTQTLVSGGKYDEDILAIKAIREMVGDRIELRYDCQGRFDRETARELCDQLEPERLQFVIDPLVVPEIHAVAALGRQTSIPLAAWRTIHGPADVLTCARCSAAPFVVIDLEYVGGIVPARACAAVASAAGVIPLLGGRASLGIATAAAMHMTAAWSAFATSNEILSRQLRDSILTTPFEIADGMITVPQSHGLGIEVDRSKVERRQPSA
jgi:L-alanine-DL-glutamate epimerase-like enolase superfamily enzyme